MTTTQKVASGDTSRGDARAEEFVARLAVAAFREFYRLPFEHPVGRAISNISPTSQVWTELPAPAKAVWLRVARSVLVEMLPDVSRLEGQESPLEALFNTVLGVDQ